MLFSHPHDHHAHGSRPVRPLAHENLFLEPRHEPVPEPSVPPHASV